MIPVVCYDVEIAKMVEETPGGWNNPEAMGLGTAVAFTPHDRRYRFFNGEEGKEPLRFFLKQADMIVGFNHVNFDHKVVFGNKYQSNPLLDTYDIGGNKEADLFLMAVKGKFGESLDDLLEQGKARSIFNGSLSLDAICGKTIGLEKTGHGANAPVMYQAGKIVEVLEYNLNDIIMTWELYKHVRRYGFLIDGNNGYIEINHGWTSPGFLGV